METCFSAVLLWIAVFGIVGWMIKLLAFKIWSNKLQADLRGRNSARFAHSFPTSSNEPQENDEQKEPEENDERESRKEPEENDERESWKEPEENDQRFA